MELSTNEMTFCEQVLQTAHDFMKSALWMMCDEDDPNYNDLHNEHCPDLILPFKELGRVDGRAGSFADYVVAKKKVFETIPNLNATIDNNDSEQIREIIKYILGYHHGPHAIDIVHFDRMRAIVNIYDEHIAAHIRETLSYTNELITQYRDNPITSEYDESVRFYLDQFMIYIKFSIDDLCNRPFNILNKPVYQEYVRAGVSNAFESLKINISSLDEYVNRIK